MSGRPRLPSAGLQRYATWRLVVMPATTALWGLRAFNSLLWAPWQDQP